MSERAAKPSSTPVIPALQIPKRRDDDCDSGRSGRLSHRQTATLSPIVSLKGQGKSASLPGSPVGDKRAKRRHRRRWSKKKKQAVSDEYRYKSRRSRALERSADGMTTIVEYSESRASSSSAASTESSLASSRKSDGDSDESASEDRGDAFGCKFRGVEITMFDVVSGTSSVFSRQPTYSVSIFANLLHVTSASARSRLIKLTLSDDDANLFGVHSDAGYRHPVYILWRSRCPDFANRSRRTGDENRCLPSFLVKKRPGALIQETMSSRCLRKIPHACFAAFPVSGLMDATGAAYFAYDVAPYGDLLMHILSISSYVTYHSRLVLARQIAYQVLLVLRDVHAMEWAHRDVKPDNVLIMYSTILDRDVDVCTSPSARFVWAKLSDWEFAAPIERPTTDFPGSPEYAAPEIMRASTESAPSEIADPRKADIYSLGLTIYTILSFSTPENGRVSQIDMENLMMMSPAAAAFVRYCCMDNPDYRPTASDLLDHRWLDPKSPDLSFYSDIADFSSPRGGMFRRYASRLNDLAHIAEHAYKYKPT